jgi:hypothetical protein
LQLLLHEKPNIVGAHGTTKLPAYLNSNLLKVFVPVRFRGYQVEQTRRLDNLAVGSPYKVNRLLES